MKATRSVMIALIALFLLIVGVYLLQLPGITHPILTNSLFLIPPALATISSIYAMRVYHPSSLQGRAMSFVSAGLACWFIGEVIFFMYQFVFHTNPFPSLADVFYLAAYPLLLIGLTREVLAYGGNWRNLRGANKLVMILSSLLLVVLAFIVVYFGVYLAYQAGAPWLNNFIALSYGIGDLILLIPVLFILKMVLDFRGGKLFYSWLLVLIALFCIMAGDILFAIYTKQYDDLVPAYTLIDLAWVAGYLLFSYSFFYTGQTIKQLQSTLVAKKD